jgi:hypothetical protein
VKTFYVWSTSPSSGESSMRGVRVHARTPREAVVEAVEKTLDESGDCCLLSLVRVSRVPHGADHLDVYFEAPFEKEFPALFAKYPDFAVATVEAL